MSTSYLICQTYDEAAAISARVAAEQGCTGDVTTRWFACVQHPTDGRAAVVVPDAEAGKLHADEQAALIPSLTADWTPAAR